MNRTSSVQIYSFLRALRTTIRPCSYFNGVAHHSTSPVRIVVGGTGHTSMPRFAVVITRDERYLINCTESTSRMIEHGRIGVMKLNNIFLTSNKWYNMAGIAGIFLIKRKIVDNSPPNPSERYLEDSLCWSTLNIHGPEVVGRIIDTFVKKDKYSEKLCNYAISNIFEEAFVNHEFEIHALKFTEPGSASKFPPDHSYAYLFKNIAGRIVERNLLNKHNVPPAARKSTNLEALRSGRDIALHSGRIIRWEDVTLPKTDVSPFMFLENPSLDHVEVKLSCPRFKHLIAHFSPSLVIHFTPSSVQQLDQHRLFLRLFPEDTHHVFIGGEEALNPLLFMTKRQAFLHYFCSRRVFPLPPLLPTSLSAGDCSRSWTPLSNEDWGKLDATLVDHVTEDKCNTSVLLASESEQSASFPLTNLGVANAFRAAPMQVIDAHSRKHGFVVDESRWPAESHIVSELIEGGSTSLEEFYRRVTEVGTAIDEDLEAGILSSRFSNFPKFAFLGTGSSAPSLYRNTAAILVRCSPDNSILLDCGEGTLMQIFTMYGEQEATKILRSIRLICLTHSHIDHHLGLMELLIHRRRVFKEAGIREPNIHVVGPPDLSNLAAWHRRWFGHSAIPTFAFDQTNFVTPRHNKFAAKPRFMPISDENEHFYDLVAKLGFRRIDAVPVNHCVYATGFVLRHKLGWKMVYSGDTIPCNSLVEAGRRCDLLIHEATFENGREQEARKKRHSTVNEAVEIGRKMGARFTMLTHFSQRYSNAYYINPVPSNVGYAQDMMEVTFEDLPYLCYSRDLISSVSQLARGKKNKTCHNRDRRSREVRMS